MGSILKGLALPKHSVRDFRRLNCGCSYILWAICLKNFSAADFNGFLDQNLVPEELTWIPRALGGCCSPWSFTGTVWPTFCCLLVLGRFGFVQMSLMVFHSRSSFVSLLKSKVLWLFTGRSACSCPSPTPSSTEESQVAWAEPAPELQCPMLMLTPAATLDAEVAGFPPALSFPFLWKELQAINWKNSRNWNPFAWN